MALIELQHVAKGFGAAGRRLEVLHDVNLVVQEGEFVAVVGGSGSGKTTLISLLAGLTTPDAGVVRISGAPVTGPGPERGVMFQNYSLLPWLSVFENVKLAVDQAFREWTEAARREHTEKYVKLVNLGSARDKRPAALSGGMRQRVSLARTLAARPRILLLDEPLGALDALTRGQLQGEIGRLCQEEGVTTLLITNDPDEAILLADRVIPLTRGPRATLMDSVTIGLPRPRDARFLNSDEGFKRIRNHLFGALRTAAGPSAGRSATGLVLPDLKPSEPAHLRPWFGGGAGAGIKPPAPTAEANTR